MNKKLIYGLCALFGVVVIAVVAIRIWGNSVDTPSIVIPSPSSDAAGDALGANGNRLEVGTDTVRDLLNELERSDVYSRGYQLWTYWDGGEAEAKISVWQNGDRFRVLHTQNNIGKNTMISDGKVYYWYEGSKQVFSAPLAEADTDVLDEYARLITLTELMSLPVEDIVSAGYEERNGESCIFVEYNGEGNRLYRLHVSVDKGLLISGEVLENGKRIYLMESVFTEDTVPDESIFRLP